MSDKSIVYVIIINYCHPEVTLQGVKSLRNSKNVNLKIVVVDNASPDDSLNILKKSLPEDGIILLSAKKNDGFSAGNNIGIKFALKHNADYIMLVNNDTVVDPNMVQILLNNTTPNIVTAPKIYYYSQRDRIWFAGGKYIPILGKYIHIGENKEDTYFDITESDWLTGCCIMFSAETIKKVGLWDETYFMYMEDVDYSLRLKQHGIKLLMIPQAHLWHKVGISSGVQSKLVIYYSNRNRLYLQKKYGINILTRFITLLTRVLLALKGLLFNTNQKYIFCSISDYCKNRMGKQN